MLTDPHRSPGDRGGSAELPASGQNAGPPDARDRSAESPGGDDRFIPSGPPSRYEPPRGRIDPDASRSWLRRALPLVLARKRGFVGALGAAFAGLVVQVQLPNRLNQAVSQSLVEHRTPLSYFVIWVVGLALLSGVFGYLSRALLLQTAYGLEYDLRNLLYEHLGRMTFGFFDRAQTGQLISRANSDIRSVQMYLAFAPFILVQCAVGLLAFGFMLSINVELALVAMATTPFVFLAGTRMRKSMFPVSWLIQSRLAEVATIVDENVNGVRVVKAFAAEERQVRTLAHAAERLRWAYIKDADLRARYAPVVQNLPQVGLAIVLLFGGYLVLHHRLGVGAILAFSAYIVMLQAPFQMLGMLVMMGQRAAASAGRIYEILDEQPGIVDSPGARQVRSPQGHVSFSQVEFRYGPQTPRVLHDCSFELRPGETVALVGRTGSGKSTVGRLLARFYDVDDGCICIDGRDIRSLTLASLRATVGIVPDEPFLFSTSVRDNIAYGRPDASEAEVVAAARAAGAEEFIVDLPDGYATVVGERGYTLSGGQRQRIALARTLLVNPPVLVLDDATSAVDVETEAGIHASLRALMGGRTTLVIAHRLSTIGLADRVLILEDGAIVAGGTHAELLESLPLYSQILAQVQPHHLTEDADSPTVPPAPDSPPELGLWDRAGFPGGGR